MSRNAAYRRAEKIIFEAIHRRATVLDLDCDLDSANSVKLNELPESLKKLTSLQVLDLRGNRLKSLPESLSQLVLLQGLNLRDNRLRSLPDWLRNLRSLKGLYLSGNKLTSIPESLSWPKSLQGLYLTGNQLTSLPESICKLTRLQMLVLPDNQLPSLPESLSELTSLEKLDLRGNQLTLLPESLGRLKLLKELDLRDNQLIFLPESIRKLTSLEKLDLRGNQLTSLPESLGRLKLLQKLDLHGNKLTSLPISLSQLRLLKEIDASENCLSYLPKSLIQLRSLKELDLSYNQLTSLPEFLSKHPSLEKLDLRGNELTLIPESLSQLTSLKELDLSYNQLTSLPESLSKLPFLEKLVLSGNQLTLIPESLSQLTSLKTLDLSFNQLLTIPDLFGQLSSLRNLMLYGNRLKTLPVSLAQLRSLWILTLDKNPLNPELRAAYKQGIDELLSYLRGKAEDQIILNEAKLILIGEGEVGKTSLLGALRGDEWIEDRKMTRGVEVDIKSLVLTDPDSKTDITFNGWDFGGQSIYRPTHQLYFTAPAVYLAVWNPRRGTEQCCVDEWIKMVKQRAYDESQPEEHPRILVVATHSSGECLAHIDEQQLRDEFGELIVGFHHVDSRTGEGIEELKSAIAHTADSIPSVGREVPTNWKNMLEALRKRSQQDAYITYKQFRSLCHRQKVSNELADTYAVILNRLGHLIHYGNDAVLQDTVILKPEWLSKAMSYVLEDGKAKADSGLVTHKRLNEIWDDPTRNNRERYPQELHPVFLKLMERFDLSYLVELPEADAVESILIAQLVPDTRPSNWEQEWPTQILSNDSERTQVCQIFDAETGKQGDVTGLFFRLIVRLHRYSLGRDNYNKSLHWNGGMILDDGPNGRAFLEEIRGDIFVKVRAAYPERFLHLLCEEVRWLVQYFWKGLKCQFAVPCDSPCKGLLDLEEMHDNLKQGMDKIRCSVCRQYHSINEKLSTSTPKPSVNLVLYELKQGQSEILRGMKQGFAEVSTNLKRLISLADEQFAALMTTLTDPAKEGPRLFSFEPVKPGFFDKPTWMAQKFRLTLWCEHARLPLPLLTEDNKRGVYEIELTRDWLKKSAPFLKFLSATLSLALPVAAPAAKIAMDKANYNAIENQLNFGKACAESFLKGTNQVGEWLTSDDEAEMEATRKMLAEGSTLRELHALLKAKDPANSFGGLVRVQNKQYKFFWVHEKFVSEY